MDEPVTDLHTLVEKSVDAKMKPLMTSIFLDNEYTRLKISENTALVTRVLNRYGWVRDVAIAILYLIFLFSMTGCAVI